ncbi:MAG: flagellar hook assembly protein FlgD [Rhodocyclaceae bacterium]|nr:flagellar hook assembly protein FlgD [Rhodocyclaceae bacterium]
MSSISNNGAISASVLASINGTSSKSSTGSTSASTTDPTSAQGIQDRFLNLLVTQLQNQDPLNPMDNAQMTTQLAQISTVGGLAQLNTSLQSLLATNTDNQTLQAAGLIGKNVLVKGGSMTLSQGQAGAALNLAGNADVVTVAVKDASGNQVKTLNLGGLNAGVRSFTWDGGTDAGGKAADGVYTITATASMGGQDVTATTLGSGVVSSITRDSTGVRINLGSQSSVALADIQQIL